MEHYELRVLADYTHTGLQAANTTAKPSPRDVLGELERDERAEVVFAEIFPPVSGGGEEDLKKIIPILDGEKYGEYVSLSGIASSVMAPPKRSIWGNQLYSFGTPMSNNPLLSTTLKYSESITFECLAGAAQITADYRIRLWGYVYKETELPRVFGTMGGGITGRPDLFAQMIDRARGRTLNLAKDTPGGIPVNGDTWKTLPGGKDQSIPKINPFIRFAYNKVATDGMQGDYQFRYDTGNVDDSDENMYFDFNALNALLVVGLGIRADAPGHLAKTALKIAGDYHPKRLIPTTLADNPLHFGLTYPFIFNTLPENPFYYAIPKLERPYLIWNEIGMVIVQDDGTAVVINDLIACITGTRVELKG
ncbi:unnamed protein product [marine sediment metagenome]|uniref:Uncharacterized protein n=1 Tax=marine sediment metagenome TaxID=412755 RepID=X1S4Q0_9ZZZZ